MSLAMTGTDQSLLAEIQRLKKERNAVILAHNYQIGPIQDLADYTGDSLGLSHMAARTDADVIVMCGVYFMAETAAILSPEKTVLIPDAAAGCSLADSITVAQLRAWKAEHPGAVVVAYVNTSAAVKAESDYCCTSSNAVKVVQSIPEGREILFLPDMFLGEYVRKVTGRKMHIWAGECHVHAGIRPEMLTTLRAAHPDAETIIHPECSCTSSTLYLMEEGLVPKERTAVLSTSAMLDHVRKSPAEEFVVATETGILHQLRRNNPGKRFYAASDSAVCMYMKMITVEKVRDSLRNLTHHVTVPQETAERARLAIQRMVEIV